MSFISGLAKALAPMVLTAITGGAAAPLMAMAMKMVAMEVAKQLIQVIGEKLGLPQGIIDMAKMACASAAGMPDSARSSFREGVGNLARDMNLSPSDSGRFERNMQSSVNESFDSMQPAIESFINNVNSASATQKERGDGNSVTSGKGSILMRLAVALGKIADQKANSMADKADQIGNLGKIEAKNQSKFSQMNAELNALGQEFGIISQAMNNVLKSIGEGASTVARKG